MLGDQSRPIAPCCTGWIATTPRGPPQSIPHLRVNKRTATTTARTVSTLHSTAFVAGAALRVAAHDSTVAAHYDTHPEAADLLDRLGRFISKAAPTTSGCGRSTSFPYRTVQPACCSPLEVVRADLRRHADQRQDDGGWRGYATLTAWPGPPGKFATGRGLGE
jgi:hypothetical protein